MGNNFDFSNYSSSNEVVLKSKDLESSSLAIHESTRREKCESISHTPNREVLLDEKNLLNILSLNATLNSQDTLYNKSIIQLMFPI